MSDDITIFSIQTAPGDVPRGVEQPNGDLLLPAGARCLIELALLQVELALPGQPELAAVERARQLLGIEPPRTQPGWLVNLNKIRPL
jgi:hypothetical protein